MLCSTQKWVVHWSFKFWVLLSGTYCQKLTVEWHWLKFFRARFSCLSVSLISAAVKFVTNGWWTGQPSPTTLNGFTRNAKRGFNSWKWSNLAWNSSGGLTIYFGILPLRGLQLPLRAKSIRSHSDIGKWQNAFDNMCLWKIFIFLWEFSSLTWDLGSLSLLSNRPGD